MHLHMHMHLCMFANQTIQIFDLMLIALLSSIQKWKFQITKKRKRKTKPNFNAPHQQKDLWFKNAFKNQAAIIKLLNPFNSTFHFTSVRYTVATAGCK